MALYFISTSNFPLGKKEIQWHVGEKIAAEIFKSFDCVKVHADGDELDYVRNHFYNIPLCTNRVIVWSGDFAKFIFDNFPAKLF